MTNRLYYHVIHPSVSWMTYKLLSSGGNRIRTERRKMFIVQFSGTIGPSQHPTFFLGHKIEGRHILPRPFVTVDLEKLDTGLWVNANGCSHYERYWITHPQSFERWKKSDVWYYIETHTLL